MDDGKSRCSEKQALRLLFERMRRENRRDLFAEDAALTPSTERVAEAAGVQVVLVDLGFFEAVRAFFFGGENVRGVDRGDGAESRFAEPARGVMHRDGFNDGLGQAPRGEQAAAKFGMIDAEEIDFGAAQRDFHFAGVLDGAGKGFAAIGREEELTDVVEQSGRESLIAGLAARTFDLGNPAGIARGGDGMADELVDGKFDAFGGGKAADGMRKQDHRFGRFEAEIHDRFAGAGHVHLQRKDRAVHELQNFRAHRRILFDQFANFFERRAGGSERIQNAMIQFGRARQDRAVRQQTLRDRIRHPKFRTKRFDEARLNRFGIGRAFDQLMRGAGPTAGFVRGFRFGAKETPDLGAALADFV